MKYMLMFLFSFVIGTVVQADEPDLLFSLSDSGIARIGVINKYDFSLKLKIESENGNAIFDAKIEEGDKFFKFYDLSELESGTYTVELKGKGIKETRSFTVTDGQAAMIQTPDTKAPAIQLKDNKLYVEMDNNYENGIILTIRDKNTVFYQELAIHDMVINKAIELNDLPKGQYTLTVKTAQKLYNYDFAAN